MAKTKIEWADKCGKNNPNWRGGRVITEHGYILLRLPGHHLSDVRGYVYEHRLVAERKLGRKLKAGEIVHHIDGNKENNDESNIIVVPNIAHHWSKHRKNKLLRLPGEANPLIRCECGCGKSFYKYDNQGRPRRFISGHNMRRRELCQTQA